MADVELLQLQLKQKLLKQKLLKEEAKEVQEGFGQAQTCLLRHLEVHLEVRVHQDDHDARRSG